MSTITRTNTVSLIDTLIPPLGSVERDQVDRTTLLNVNEGKPALQEKFRNNAKLGQLFLLIARDTAAAFEQANYRKFDALIRNFGCQMTALEILRICDSQSPERQELLMESQRLQQTIEPLLERCLAGTQNPITVDQTTHFADYLRNRLGIDVRISRTFARLVRLRMLSIVNKEDEQNRPCTEINKLYGMVTTKLKPSAITSILKFIVTGIQAQESRISADFIRTIAANLPADDPDDQTRKKLLMRLLSNAYECNAVVNRASAETPTSFVPLSYNTETVLRAYTGIVLVKNKLTIGGRPLPVLPIQLFLELPTNRILSSREVRVINPNTPLLVVEGFIKREAPLRAAIRTLGLKSIISANCALLPQYSAATREGRDIAFRNDVEAQNDIQAVRLGTQNTLLLDAQQIEDTIINVDHIYCATIAEETAL